PAGSAAERRRRRLGSRDLQGTCHPRHLRTADVRNLVQDDADGADRFPAAQGADASNRDRGLSEGLRPDGVGQLRQSRLLLELRILMTYAAQARLSEELDSIRDSGLFKHERIIVSPQSAEITLQDGRKVLNFCANNYLGLADHPRLIDAAKKALDTHGYGMASVRFICGTQDLHKELERKIAKFFGTDDAILYAACFDANGGLFEPLLGEQDAIISDALNHASIIDGIRLCKARRFRYTNCDTADLEKQLQAADAASARSKLISSDGVFSMDGFIAPLDRITALAKQYN